MFKTPICIIDLETTGTNSNLDKVIEVGILRVENDKVVDTFESLINPQAQVSQFVQALTGIHPDVLLDAPLFEDVSKKIIEIIDGTLIVAHNAIFDVSFLLSEYRNINTDLGLNYLCSVQLSRKIFGGGMRHNLDSIIERHNLQVSDRHRALDDARCVFQYLQILKSQYTPEHFDIIIENLIKYKANNV